MRGLFSSTKLAVGRLPKILDLPLKFQIQKIHYPQTHLPVGTSRDNFKRENQIRFLIMAVRDLNRDFTRLTYYLG